MRSKLALSVLVAASLVGATSMASAQMQPAPGASSEGNVGPGTASSSHMKSSGKMKSSTTTGMNKGTTRHPSGQGTVSPGTDNSGGMNSK